MRVTREAAESSQSREKEVTKRLSLEESITAEDIDRLLDEAQEAASAIQGPEVAWRPAKGIFCMMMKHYVTGVGRRSLTPKGFTRRFSSRATVAEAQTSLQVRDLGQLVVDALQVL